MTEFDIILTMETGNPTEHQQALIDGSPVLKQLLSMSINQNPITHFYHFSNATEASHQVIEKRFGEEYKNMLFIPFVKAIRDHDVFSGRGEDVNKFYTKALISIGYELGTRENLQEVIGFILNRLLYMGALTARGDEKRGKILLDFMSDALKIGVDLKLQKNDHVPAEYHFAEDDSKLGVFEDFVLKSKVFNDL